MNSTLTKRNSSLDIIRIIAVLAVIMIHCSSTFLSSFERSTNVFLVGNLFDSLSRIGVPLFIMISGALFLDEQKEVTLKGIFSKNIKNLAIITVIWACIYSLVYTLLLPILKHQAISAKSVIYAILNGHNHMWYLYMILGLYMITPFLKKFVCKENKGMVLFFILVSFLAQFSMPVINMICKLGMDIGFIKSWIQNFHLQFFNGYIAYFLLGWYMVHVGIRQKWIRCIVYVGGMVSLAGMVFYVQFTGDYETVYHNLGAPVFLYSASVFLALNNRKLNLKEKSTQLLAHLSKLTFGVYIVHILVLTVCQKFFHYSSNPVLYIIGLFMMVTCLSFLITYMMSKIPVVKKLIKS